MPIGNLLYGGFGYDRWGKCLRHPGLAVHDHAGTRTRPWLRRGDKLGRMLGCLALMIGIACSSCSKRGGAAQLRLDAARGVPEAQFKLGVAYYDGMEITQDHQAAASWFRRAAEQGHEVAQFALGEMLLRGEGFPADEVEAAGWIRKSAEQGYAPAQDELAMMYSKGAGVGQNDFEAVNWATKAAEQGLPEAQFHLGSFLCGKIPSKVPPDDIAACMWLSLAAAAGQGESEDSLPALQAKLTPSQLEEVKKRVEAWNRNHGPRP